MDRIIHIIIDSYMVGLPIVLTYLAYSMRQSKKARAKNSCATMLLLRVQLMQYHDKATNRGHISQNELQTFLDMKNVYNALGGNCFVEQLSNEIKMLPIKN